MKFGVVQFPGSNCDDDAHHAIGAVMGQPVEFIWHQSEQVAGFDAIILPGGFAFGDYLRTGAIARFSPVMDAVGRFARSGGLVLGICNGFQILLEAGLLPGAMTAEQTIAISLPPGAGSRGIDRYAVYVRGAEGRRAANAHRAHGRELFLRRGNAGGNGAQRSDHFSIRSSGWRMARGERRRLARRIRMDRSARLRESAIGSGTCWG